MHDGNFMIGALTLECAFPARKDIVAAPFSQPNEGASCELRHRCRRFVSVAWTTVEINGPHAIVVSYLKHCTMTTQ